MCGIGSFLVYSVLGVLGASLVACSASQAPARQPAGPDPGERTALAPPLPPPPPPPAAARPASAAEEPARDDDEDAEMAAWQVAMDKWKEEQRAREASPEVDRAPGPPPPPPPPPPLNVPPLALDAMRIAGEKNIVPDDVTKTAISESGRDKVIGSYKLCIKRSGAVASVTQLKTTGFPSYDQKIMSKIRTQWRYRPFLINYKPARVCTDVTFIYAQHTASPAPKASQPPPAP